MVVRCAPRVGEGDFCARDRPADFRLVDADSPDREPAERTECWVEWNDEGFFLFARMEDSDVIGGLDRDEVLHFQHGDTLELFLKPANAPHYCEMYATPLGRKATLYFRAPRGEPQPDPLASHGYRGLRVASRAIDSGWEAEMRVPAEELAAWGGGWGREFAWTLLVARYNHGARFPAPERSGFPPLSAVDFHLVAEYARLVLL